MVMPRVPSDHRPFLLQCGDWEKQKPCKFENWWLEVEGFQEQVYKWWNECEVMGCLDYIPSVSA